MRTNPLFSLHYIADTPYILPHGQLIADHYRGLKLNDTGVFIWNTINSGVDSMDKLMEECVKYFEAEPDEAADISNDISNFVSQLRSQYMIIDGDFSDSAVSTPVNTEQVFANSGYAPANCDSYILNIAGIQLNISAPDGTFAEEFMPFEHSNSEQPIKDTITINIHTDKAYPSEPFSDSAPVIINHDLEIYEHSDRYSFFFPASDKLMYAELDKSGHFAKFFCKEPDEYDLSTTEDESIYERLRKMKEARQMPVSSLPEDEMPTPRLKDDIFHAIRLMFLYLAHKHGMLMLHSASLLYQDKAWLFSASSGTGKSTHTNLWTKLYGTPLIDGDLNLIMSENGVPVVKGTPWCGTSGIFDTETHPLGGIIMLKRNPTDTVEELPIDQQRLLILQRLISPAWDKNQINSSIKFIDQIADNILVCRLHCTKEDSAAICIKERIDRFLDAGR